MRLLESRHLVFTSSTVGVLFSIRLAHKAGLMFDISWFYQVTDDPSDPDGKHRSFRIRVGYLELTWERGLGMFAHLFRPNRRKFGDDIQTWYWLFPSYLIRKRGRSR